MLLTNTAQPVMGRLKAQIFFLHLQMPGGGRFTAKTGAAAPSLLCAQHRACTQASDRPSADCEPGYVHETQKVEGNFQYFPLQEESITATFCFPTSTEKFWTLRHPQSLHPAQDLSSPGIFHAAAPITNSPGGQSQARSHQPRSPSCSICSNISAAARSWLEAVEEAGAGLQQGDNLPRAPEPVAAVAVTLQLISSTERINLN